MVYICYNTKNFYIYFLSTMSQYYFGFLPSALLIQNINELNQLVANRSNERYDTYRNQIVHLISKELLEAMLVKLIDNLPDTSERKAHLIKICQSIETAVDKLIDTIIGSASNQEVLPSVDFLQQKTLLVDNQGQQRIGFQLEENLARNLLKSFANVKQGNGISEVKNLTDLLTQLSQASLQHFLTDFTKTLNLGLLKRSAIPIAHGVIAKGVDIAVHKLLPQLQQEALERLVNYYGQLIVEK